MRPTRGLGSAPLPPANRGCALLFGLAPGGVCRVSLRPRGAGIVTVALVLASRRTGVTRHPALGSSDFPHAARVAPHDARPSGRLAGRLSLRPRAAEQPAGLRRDRVPEDGMGLRARGGRRPPGRLRRAPRRRGTPRPSSPRRCGTAGAAPPPSAAPPRSPTARSGPSAPRAAAARRAARPAPLPSGPVPEAIVMSTSVPAPRAISCAWRPKIDLRSFVPSMSTARSTGACERRHGRRYGCPLRPSVNGSSHRVVRPLSPSSTTWARSATSAASTPGQRTSRGQRPPVTGFAPWVLESP